MSNNQEQHVIFGTGAIGTAIMNTLLVKGKSVRMVNRSGKANLPEQVELMSGDANNLDFSRKAAEGASVIYFTLNPPYERWQNLFPPLQQSVLDAAISSEAKLVAIENLYMYGDTQGKPMTEDMPYTAHTVKGQTRAAMSDELMEAHRAGKVQVTMGRASDFFGPGATDQSMLGDRVIYPALAGKTAQTLGNVDMKHSYTYVPDIGKALVLLAEREEALGQAWHIPSPEVMTTREIVNMIYEETGYPPKMQGLPKIVFYSLGLFMPTLREMREMMYEFEAPFIMDTRKFEKAFGDEMQATSMKDAIRETVQWFRDHPKT